MRDLFCFGIFTGFIIGGMFLYASYVDGFVQRSSELQAMSDSNEHMCEVFDLNCKLDADGKLRAQ